MEVGNVCEVVQDVSKLTEPSPITAVVHPLSDSSGTLPSPSPPLQVAPHISAAASQGL